MAYYEYLNEETLEWEWHEVNPLDLAQFHSPYTFGYNDFPLEYSPIITPPDNSSEYAPTSIDTPSETYEEMRLVPSRKRQLSSEDSQADAMAPSRKTRKIRDPCETAKVRKRGACFSCQKKRKECQIGPDPNGACRGCWINKDKITVVPGLQMPLCWRPNMGGVENFRRGPTAEFAFSLRGSIEDAGPEKQVMRTDFAVRRIRKEQTKTVELSQNGRAGSNTLSIKLERYKPEKTDKQYYSWFDDGVEQRYDTPAYGISQRDAASTAIDRFLVKNFDAYIDAQMRDANEITMKTFKVARQQKHLPLVERALKLWVACRFIEDPWSIVGPEKFGLSTDPNPNSPYHDRVPVPPIVDLQIDLIIIKDTLQPELKNILRMLKTMLESSEPWTNWFEIYLTYFILLHNVELTMVHDAWFVKRNNLKTKYSNKPLVNSIMNGANTLLTCFHYAHQGYAPFTNHELDESQQWTREQRSYLEDVRPLLMGLRGEFVQDPSKELFWTSQLYKPDWRPVVVVC